MQFVFLNLMLCFFLALGCTNKMQIETEKTPKKFIKATCANGLLSDAKCSEAANGTDSEDEPEGSLPTWASLLSDIDVDAQTAITPATAVASDVDEGSSITYSFDSANMSCDDGDWNTTLAVNSSTGVLTGTPEKADVGSCTVKILATSGDDSISQDVTVNVAAIEGEEHITAGEMIYDLDFVWNGTEFGMVYVEKAGQRDLYFQRMSAGGVALGSRTTISVEGDSNYADNPQIVWTGTEYGIVYNDEKIAGDTHVFLARVSAAGVLLGETHVSVGLGINSSAVQKVVWSGTEYGVIFMDSATTTDRNVYFARVDTDGNVVGSWTRLTPDDAFNADSPNIIWDGTRYVIVYDDGRLGDNNIYLTRMSAAGANLGETLITVDDTAGAGSAQVVWSGTEYGLVYADNRLGDYNTYFARVNTSGVMQGSEVLLSVDDTAGSQSARIIWNGTNYVVTYYDNRLTDSNIYFTRVDASGSIIGSETRITPDDSGSVSGYISLAWNGSEYGMVYTDDRTTDTNIYFARLDSSGAVIGSEILLTIDDIYLGDLPKIVWNGTTYGIGYRDNRTVLSNLYFDIRFDSTL